ncbi:MAG: DUF4157 domain-containing protein, partial [Pseudonocardiales bacterium]|nr:DUF4157 domain-containing protein [Pseudonocardiales bacterium]
MSEESYRVDTLGQRLDRQARQLVERRMPSCAWADPLAVLLDHLAELPTPADTRYTRVEAAPAQPAELERRHEMVGDRVDAGRALPSDVAERLRTHVGPAAAAMRVHDGEHADAVAGRHSADAVTVGADVFFRSGRYRPREPRGFGLLVHEATHVVERLQCGA